MSNIISLQERAERLEKTLPDLPPGGGGGTPPGMERVWEKLSEHDKRFDKTEAKLDTIGKDVAEMKGRLSAMPTSWQLMGMILAIMGASFAIIRFGLGKI